MKNQKQLEILWAERTAAESAIDAAFYRLASLEAERAEHRGLPLDTLAMIALEAEIETTKATMARDKRDLAVLVKRIMAVETELQRRCA